MVTHSTVSDILGSLVMLDRHLIVAHTVLETYKLFLGNIETILAVENVLNSLGPVSRFDYRCRLAVFHEFCTFCRGCKCFNFDFDRTRVVDNISNKF